MPFIPHTDEEVAAMLEVIGVDSIEALFDEIPGVLRTSAESTLNSGMNEMAIGKLMRERANRDGEPLCFAGAGAYDHHIPAAVWELVLRGVLHRLHPLPG